MILNKLLGLVLLCFAAVFYYTWTWSPVLAQFGGDNATYLLTANLFSPFSPASHVSEYFAKLSQYPPLYPLLLAYLGGGNSILIAHLVTTTFLLCSLVALFYWVSFLKIENTQPLLLVIIFAIIPGTYMQALSIHSETLYLLFSISSLCAVAYKEKTGEKNWLWLAAILIACSSLTRSAGFSLVCAFILYVFLKQERDKYQLSVAVLFPMITWNIFNEQHGTSYLEAFTEYYTNDFLSAFLNQIYSQSIYIWRGWILNFTYGKSGHILLGVIGISCFIGMLYRAFKRKLDGLYTLLYLAMIMVWPYPAESTRLIFSILPVLLVQAGIFVAYIPRMRINNVLIPVANIILLGTLFITAVPNLILTINRFNLDVADYLTPFKHTYAWYNPDIVNAKNEIILNHGIVSSLHDAKKYVPQSECVYSIKPSIIGIHLDRISYILPDDSINDDEFYKLIEQSNCNYFYFMSILSPSYKKALYPIERLHGKLNIIKIYNTDNNGHENTVAILGKLKRKDNKE